MNKDEGVWRRIIPLDFQRSNNGGAANDNSKNAPSYDEKPLWFEEVDKPRLEDIMLHREFLRNRAPVPAAINSGGKEKDYSKIIVGSDTDDDIPQIEEID